MKKTLVLYAPDLRPLLGLCVFWEQQQKQSLVGILLAACSCSIKVKTNKQSEKKEAKKQINIAKTAHFLHSPVQ